MARPKKYDESWVQLTNNYVDDKVSKNELPTQAQLAYSVLACDEDTISNCLNEKDESGDYKYIEFFGAVKRLQAVQKHMLLNFGLNKTWNSGMARFILTNNHGMHENSRFTISSVNREPIEIMYITPKDIDE